MIQQCQLSSCKYLIPGVAWRSPGRPHSLPSSSLRRTSGSSARAAGIWMGHNKRLGTRGVEELRSSVAAHRHACFLFTCRSFGEAAVQLNTYNASCINLNCARPPASKVQQLGPAVQPHLQGRAKTHRKNMKYYWHYPGRVQCTRNLRHAETSFRSIS